MESFDYKLTDRSKSFDTQNKSFQFVALDEAKEQYRQVSRRYKAGVGDAIELKDGENTYLNARLDFYNSVLNYNVTAAELEKEIGVPLIFSDEKILDLNKEEL